jgi:hypothetical protein
MLAPCASAAIVEAATMWAAFHASFENPLTPGAPPRESIEVRTLLFFPPGTLIAMLIAITHMEPDLEADRK